MENSERNMSAQLYELEPDKTVDISEQAFEELRVSLEKVEAMKQTVAEGIIKAKEKNLKDHVEKFRALLRKLVIMENSLKEEQTTKEAAKLAFELDQLEAECGREIADNQEVLETAENESKSALISIRFGIAAKLLGFGGVFACLLGCIVYLTFAQIDAMAVSFHWFWLIINAVGVVLFTMMGISLNKKSLYYAGLAEEDARKLALEEEKQAEKLAAGFSDIMAAAYALELEAAKVPEEPEAEEKKEDDELIEENTHGKILSVKKVKKGKTEGVHVTVKGHPQVVLAVLATGVAAVVAAIFMKNRQAPKAEKPEKKKKAAEKGAEKAPALQGVCFLLNQ